MHDDPYDIPLELIAQVYSTGTILSLTPRNLLAYIKRTIYKRNAPIASLSSGFENLRVVPGIVQKYKENRDSVFARKKRYWRAEGLGTILTATRHCRANFIVIFVVIFNFNSRNVDYEDFWSSRWLKIRSWIHFQSMNIHQIDRSVQSHLLTISILILIII